VGRGAIVPNILWGKVRELMRKNGGCSFSTVLAKELASNEWPGGSQGSPPILRKSVQDTFNLPSGKRLHNYGKIHHF
jgi:hypothetical protein